MQSQLIASHPVDNPVFVEGGFTVWLRSKSLTYFVLQADCTEKCREYKNKPTKDDYERTYVLGIGIVSIIVMMLHTKLIVIIVKNLILSANFTKNLTFQSFLHESCRKRIMYNRSTVKFQFESCLFKTKLVK